MELFVVGFVFLVGLLALGMILAVASLLWWLIALPFRILGWILGLVGLVVAAPLVLIAFLVAAVGAGVGTLLLGPLLPLLLLGAGAWWLFRRRARKAEAAPH
jgi:hypothetical protein